MRMVISSVISAKSILSLGLGLAWRNWCDVQRLSGIWKAKGFTPSVKRIGKEGFLTFSAMHVISGQFCFLDAPEMFAEIIYHQLLGNTMPFRGLSYPFLQFGCHVSVVWKASSKSEFKIRLNRTSFYPYRDGC